MQIPNHLSLSAGRECVMNVCVLTGLQSLPLASTQLAPFTNEVQQADPCDGCHGCEKQGTWESPSGTVLGTCILYPVVSNLPYMAVTIQKLLYYSVVLYIAHCKVMAAHCKVMAVHCKVMANGWATHLSCSTEVLQGLLAMLSTPRALMCTPE